MLSSVTFLGGVRTVTGSRFLVEHGGVSVLVDCGLFQGPKELRLRNWDRCPADPATIDAVVLTHAHLDHSGWFPRLVQDGFRGQAWCTRGTADLTAIVLPDSGHLQEEEAGYANRAGYSRHRPALPLYDEQQARAALDRLRVAPFDEEVEVADGVHVTFRAAGHILGSSSVRLRLAGGPVVVVSGDLGRLHHPVLVPPARLDDVDWVLVESTYGDRRHDDEHLVDDLADAISRTVERGGTVVIPAFAVDRTEVLLYHLGRLARAGRLPDVPVFVDSPMALGALAVYRRAIADHAPDVRPDVADGPDPFRGAHVVEVHDVDGSKRLDRHEAPAIVVSASGMATGGRVVHHLVACLPERRDTVILPGYQAEGTRGRQLVEGATSLKLLGQYVPVRAEIVHLPAFSVHADREELVDWLASAAVPPVGVLVVHGEEAASRALAAGIEERLDLMAAVPRLGERVRVSARGGGVAGR